MNNKAGFSLVEIMVVIAIIGILSSILYVNFDDARGEARNKAMQTEMKEVQLAVELFRAQYDRYPGVDSVNQPTCGGGLVAQQGGTRGASNCAGFINYIGEAGVGYLAPEFIPTLPLASDSNNSNCFITYETDATGGWYKLTANRCLENAETAADGIGEDEEFSRCPSSCTNCGGVGYDETDADFYESMAVYSAGGECE